MLLSVTDGGVIPEFHTTVIPECIYRGSSISFCRIDIPVCHCHPQLDWGSRLFFPLDSRFRGNDKKNRGNDLKETLRRWEDAPQGDGGWCHSSLLLNHEVYSTFLKCSIVAPVTRESPCHPPCHSEVRYFRTRSEESPHFILFLFNLFIIIFHE